MFLKLLDVVGHREGRPAIQQNLQNLIVVPVGGEDQRRYVWGKGCGVDVHFLPAL